MNFADTLKLLPDVSGLDGLDLLDAQGQTVATLDNRPGQAGSVAVYAALAERFARLDADAARAGLTLYAEHVNDARAHPGKHPNIDRLFELVKPGAAPLTVRLRRRAPAA
jgi:hypothetical protein